MPSPHPHIENSTAWQHRETYTAPSLDNPSSRIQLLSQRRGIERARIMRRVSNCCDRSSSGADAEAFGGGTSRSALDGGHMNPEMHNDPRVLLALAAVVWLLFAIQTWRCRPRKPREPDNPKALRNSRH